MNIKHTSLLSDEWVSIYVESYRWFLGGFFFVVGVFLLWFFCAAGVYFFWFGIFKKNFFGVGGGGIEDK